MAESRQDSAQESPQIISTIIRFSFSWCSNTGATSRSWITTVSPDEDGGFASLNGWRRLI